MLAPLDAISLASAIIQIVDFSFKIIKETYAIYNSEKGSVAESREIEIASTRLQDLSVRLPGLRRPGQSKKSQEELDLDDLSRTCEQHADKLLQIMSKLKATSTGPQRAFESLKVTLQRHFKADEIEGLQKGLRKIQVDINTLLLAIIR